MPPHDTGTETVGERASDLGLLFARLARRVLGEVAVLEDLLVFVRCRHASVELVADVAKHTRQRRDRPVADTAEATRDDLHRQRRARVVEEAGERGLFGLRARE